MERREPQFEEAAVVKGQHSVVVRLEGGLGNQMFQYAAGRAAAETAGRRLLLDPSAIGRGLSDRKFELGAFRIAGQTIGPLERAVIRAQIGARSPHAVRVVARAIAGRRWELCRDRGEAFDTRLVSGSGDIVLEGGWQSARYADASPAVESGLRREFALRKALPSRLEAIAGAIRGCEAVCVHVRRGDYVHNAEAAAVHGVLPVGYYAAAAARIAAKVPSPSFFVFSDDLPWARGALQLPGQVRFVEEASSLAPAIDQRLMSLCRHFIIANSTFSWWAAWLGAHEGKIVIAPSRWFAEKPAPAGLIPAAWIQV